MLIAIITVFVFFFQMIMKCLGCVLVLCVLTTHNLVSSKPWEASTARYNYYQGHDTHLSNTKITTDTPTHFSSTNIYNLSDFTLSSSPSFVKASPRSTKAPKDETFFLSMLVFKDQVVGRKISTSPSKDSTLSTSNNTFRLKVINSVNRISIKPLENNHKRNNKTSSVTTTVRPTKAKSKITNKTTTRVVKKTTKPSSIRGKISTTTRPLRKAPPRQPQKQNKLAASKIIPSRKNFTELKIATNKKPVVHKIFTKLPEKPSYEVKQSWSDVPPVSPQPEIISYSPEFPINNAAPASTADTVTQASTVDNPTLNNPLSQFNLDVLPSTAGGGADCPTVHISSAMLTPLQRQGCSDISVVLNSHFHQSNSPTQRVPTAENDPGLPVEPVEAEPVEGIDDIGAAEAGAPLADAPVADPPVGSVPADPPGGGTGGLPAAASQPASGGSGGTPGGVGGLPSLPELPELPMLPEFDLKGTMDFLSWIWGGLGPIFDFFRNPWLYLVPITIFFLLGFLKVMALFPWWIPALFLFAGSKSKSNVTHYKHVHKPVYHPDGWFWNHNTKTWVNVADYVHHRRRTGGRSLSVNIPKMIEEFARKYQMVTENTQSWKTRKKIR